MKTISRSMALFFTIGALVVCIGMLAAGISLQKSAAQQDRTYTGTVEATVADYEVHQEEMEITDSNDITTTRIVDFYFPVFRYTIDGKDYCVVSDSGSGSREYQEGSTVKLCYLPEDPSKVFIAGDASRIYMPCIVYAVGLVCALIAVKAFLDFRKANS